MGRVPPRRLSASSAALGTFAASHARTAAKRRAADAYRPAETIVKRGGTSYVFVTEGTDNALVRAREAAGPDDVQVNGGADIARQYLKVGAIEELRLHLVPVTMGGGTRLFGEGSSPNVWLRPIAADTSPLATHLTYAVERAGTKDS